MATAHRRKKDPAAVRQALIDHAGRIALEKGLAAVTVQAVSAAAGVTKGGFTHHFPSKDELVEAVFTGMLDAFDEDLDRRIAADPEPWGAFTRAYVSVSFEEADRAWSAVATSMLADPEIRGRWSRWYAARLERHATTDGAQALTIVRLAADGVWLADIGGVNLDDRAGILRQLLDATRKFAR